MVRNRLFDDGYAAKRLLEATGERALVDAQRDQTESDIQIRLRKAAMLHALPVTIPIRRRIPT